MDLINASFICDDKEHSWGHEWKECSLGHKWKEYAFDSEVNSVHIMGNTYCMRCIAELLLGNCGIILEKKE